MHSSSWILAFVLIDYTCSPFSTSSSAEDAAKNEGFLKSVWHRLTEKHDDGSKPSQADSKDSNKDTEKKDADDSSKDSSKKSS